MILDKSIDCLTKQNFRMSGQGDAAQVLSLYESAKSGAFCVWNDSYPTIAEIQHDLETENLYVMTDGSKVIGAISVVPENELDDFDCCPVRMAEKSPEWWLPGPIKVGDYPLKWCKMWKPFCGKTVICRFVWPWSNPTFLPTKYIGKQDFLWLEKPRCMAMTIFSWIR